MALYMPRSAADEGNAGRYLPRGSQRHFCTIRSDQDRRLILVCSTRRASAESDPSDQSATVGRATGGGRS